MQKLTNAEIKNIELKLLIQFDLFCKKHNLKYFITYGTLLGAVRHKGFIPWDDDIDILMPRPDFEMFVKLSGNKPIFTNYETCFYRNTKTFIPYPFVKIIDTTTKVIEKTKDEKYFSGVWIDIFPLDGFPDNKIKQKLFWIRKMFWKRLCFTYSDDLSKVTNKPKKFFKTLLMPFLKIMGINRLFSKLEKICMKYNYEKSNITGCTIWGDTIYEMLEKNYFFPTKDVLFENNYFPGPANPDKYLSLLYGDYMQLPPEEKRINHEMLAYKL